MGPPYAVDRCDQQESKNRAKAGGFRGGRKATIEGDHYASEQNDERQNPWQQLEAVTQGELVGAEQL